MELKAKHILGTIRIMLDDVRLIDPWHPIIDETMERLGEIKASDPNAIDELIDIASNLANEII